MNGYPKVVTLKDGTQVTLRPMVADDASRLLAFFRNLPEEDRLFLKEDVANAEVVMRWARELDYERVLPILALVGDEVVGDATLHCQKFGWMRHVGEIRCVVAKRYQRRGLGTILAREIFDHALKRGLLKIQALMMEDQIGAIRVFERLGFVREATLPGHVMDVKGRQHNLVIMANDTSELWRKMEDLIMDTDISMKRRGE